MFPHVSVDKQEENKKPRLKPLTDAMIPTRALENTMYVVYCNRVGQEKTMSFLGRSTIAGPNGDILAQLGQECKSVTVEFTLAALQHAQQEHPFIRDLRGDLFK